MPCGSPAPLCRAAAHWSSNGGNHRPTTATNDTVFDFQALLHPGTVFEHPGEVVTHPSLPMSEKRAILDSWASDASAIASCPALRAPQGLKAPVSIDAILEALCELDGGPRTPPGGTPNRRFSGASLGGMRRGIVQWKKISEDPTRDRPAGSPKGWAARTGREGLE